MSQNQNKQPSVAELLEMSRTQIVAEAFLLDEDKNPKYLHPNKEENEYTFKEVPLKEEILKDGNNHTSILTAPQIKEFMENWEVVAYLPNTTTGFSGTLFQAKRDIPGTTIKAGEKVMSLRSTEFIDDAVRDNEATNTREIADRGWAFGQIDDLEQWFQGLRNEKLIGDGEQIRITGYSLGGHLATAFNILHRNEGLIKNTYTFNGAGVGMENVAGHGEIKEMNKDSLKDIMESFHDIREYGIEGEKYGADFLNLEPKSLEYFKEHYNITMNAIKELKEIPEEQVDEKIQEIENILKKEASIDIAPTDLFGPVNAILGIIEENKRIRRLSSGTGQVPAKVSYKDIAALDLNYQLALQYAEKNTAAYSKFIGEGSGLNNIINNERTQSQNTINGFYDIYAENPPSMVASSQMHYGTPIPITVENQPLGRGKEYTSSILTNGLKLLVDNYNHNDFGDSHSIVLITDALETLKTINSIDMNDNTELWNNILPLSTNQKAIIDDSLLVTSLNALKNSGAERAFSRWKIDSEPNTPNAQGYADGSAIDNIINSLAKTFGIVSELQGDPNGNTWYQLDNHNGKDKNGATHDFAGRTEVHKKLRELSKKIESYNLGDDVTLQTMNAAQASLLDATKVGENFGYLVALQTLSPFALISSNKDSSLNKVWQDNWGDLYQQWQKDNAARATQQPAVHFSDEWINDRVRLLMLKSFLNDENISYNSSSERFYRDIYMSALRRNQNLEWSSEKDKKFLNEEMERSLPYLNEFDIISTDDEINISLHDSDDNKSHKRIVFGGEENDDTLVAGEKGDRLYSAGGDDTLQGGKGNDHMEGGSGFDTYHIEGHDTVFDADSKGELIFGKDKVAYFIPATSNSQNSWISSNSSGEADNKFRAVREGNHLLITSVANESDKVTIRDYFSGRNTLDGTLGLNVVKPINDEGNAKEYTITPNSNNVHNEYHLGPYSYAVNGNPLNDLIFAANSRQGKTGFGLLTNTGAGNDIVFGSFYPDVIEGGADTDILSGSNHPGKLTEAQKALDNDIIAGNDGSDFIFGKAGNDILHGGNAEEYLSEDTLEGQGDWINGGEGSDKLYGSRAQDVLQGGAGSDELYGGAGNDLIVGDSDHEVRAHVMRRFEENYYPLTHIHRYNRDKDEFDPIERMKLRQKLDEESAKWTLKIDSKTQNYSISRNYSDWDNKGTYLAADKGGAADYLEGGAGNDMLIGQRGDDTLYGQSGDDILFGDDNHDKSIVGNDHLRGGSGSDTLIGGKGADKYYFFRDELKAEAGESAPIDTIIDDGRGEGNQLDEIYLDGYPITAFEWNFDKIAQRWAHASGWQIIKNGNMLNISHKDEAGRIVVKDYADGDYGLRLSENDNKPSPEPVNPEPPKPEQPKPEQPKAPTAGKPLTAQSIHEKQRLAYTLAEDAFHTANQDDKLAYSARLADGKPLPRWLSFNAATRTFSGTPGNDDVGMLNIEVSAKGKGGSASQRLTLNVINVNDAPQIGAAIANHTSESGKPLQYRLPANAFKDIDKGDVLTLSAKLENGQPLPSWLSFDGKTGQFSGTPPSSRTANNYRIAVTATDKAGAQVSQKFSLMTAAGAVNIIRGTGKESSIQGTSGNDTIYVGDNPLQGWRYKEVYGSDGDDVIYSGSGRDAIYGGAGNDILYTNGTEHDSLYGGYGDDIYRLGADFRSVSIENFDLKQYDWRPQRRDVIEFTAHKRDYFNIYRTGDNLYLQGRDGQKVSIFDQFSNHGNNQHYINEFRFTDKILTAADIKALLNNGTPGNDTLYAKPEGSRLYSGDGNDRIFGNQGNDYLYGEAGNDTIYGRAGDDYLWGEIGNDLLYGGTGKDMLNGGLGDDQLYGDADDDRLFGDKGNDLLYGGEGNDKLDGSLDDDWLFGEAGNDELFGSAGNDVLNGGSGNDKLDGYEGNDIYQFQGDFGEDIIQNRSNPAMLAGSQYDRIDFVDLKPDDLYFRKVGDNLVIISKKHAQNRVTVLSHFRDNGNTAARIDEIRFANGTKLDYTSINHLVQQNSSGNATNADSERRGNLFASDAAHQAQQMNQAMAALNGHAQPLHALAIPDEKQPLLTTVNPY